MQARCIVDGEAQEKSPLFWRFSGGVLQEFLKGNTVREKQDPQLREKCHSERGSENLHDSL